MTKSVHEGLGHGSNGHRQSENSETSSEVVSDGTEGGGELVRLIRELPHGKFRRRAAVAGVITLIGTSVSGAVYKWLHRAKDENSDVRPPEVGRDNNSASVKGSNNTTQQSNSSAQDSHNINNYGGQGGQQPGAGGGGGAAMAPNSIGGPGGPGGAGWEHMPKEFSSALDSLTDASAPKDGGGRQASIGGQAGQAPGAGGGGGAAIGSPDELGISVADAKAMLAGQNCGPTAWGAGGGGGGAMTGREVKQEDIEKGLRVVSLYLANEASDADGLLDVKGAGWNFWRPNGDLPAPAIGVIVSGIDTGHVADNAVFVLAAVIYNPSMTSVVRIPFAASAAPDRFPGVRVSLVNTRLPFAISIDRPGEWTVAIVSGARELTRIHFDVRPAYDALTRASNP
jgi:hypothetical protein